MSQGREAVDPSEFVLRRIHKSQFSTIPKYWQGSPSRRLTIPPKPTLRRPAFSAKIFAPARESGRTVQQDRLTITP